MFYLLSNNHILHKSLILKQKITTTWLFETTILKIHNLNLFFTPSIYVCIKTKSTKIPTHSKATFFLFTTTTTTTHRKKTHHWQISSLFASKWAKTSATRSQAWCFRPTPDINPQSHSVYHTAQNNTPTINYTQRKPQNSRQPQGIKHARIMEKQIK